MRLMTLFDHIAPPRVQRVRCRRAPSENHLKYTRYAGKGQLDQIRIWLTGYGSVNCGLYDRELLPIVRRKLITAAAGYPPTPLGIWQALRVVLDEFRAEGVPVPNVLPKYVETDGVIFTASVRKAGRLIECPGPYSTPEEAHEAMMAKLAVEFPSASSGQRLTLEDVLPRPTQAAPSREESGSSPVMHSR